MLFPMGELLGVSHLIVRNTETLNAILAYVIWGTNVIKRLVPTVLVALCLVGAVEAKQPITGFGELQLGMNWDDAVRLIENSCAGHGEDDWDYSGYNCRIQGEKVRRITMTASGYLKKFFKELDSFQIRLDENVDFYNYAFDLYSNKYNLVGDGYCEKKSNWIINGIGCFSTFKGSDGNSLLLAISDRGVNLMFVQN